MIYCKQWHYFAERRSYRLCNPPLPLRHRPAKTLLSVLILLALTGVLVLVFKDNWDEISAALSQLRLWQVLLVLALGLTHPLLEGMCNWIAVRSRMPDYPLRCGLDVSWLGVFGNVAAFGAGSVPMQMYYLYRCGLPVGPGAGLLTLQYVSHKCTVLLYASVLLLVQGQWLRDNTTGLCGTCLWPI